MNEPLEEMLTPQKLAELWGVHPKTIIRIFIDEPGVFKLGSEGVRVGKRQQVTIRIPVSVAKRVYEKRSQ